MGNVNTGDQVIKLDEGEEIQTFGFIVDLSSLQFNDESDQSWIQAMPLGTWMHPLHGPIVISKDRVKAFADNVNNNVRGQDLDIDYDHKALTTEAAGWVKQAKVVMTGEPKQRGLWLLVDWTGKAADQIRTKAFRYFSPEFVDKWKHPSTGQVFRDVLFGGALTNRPFLKGILPLNLSELMQANETDQGDGGVMDRKALETLATNLSVKFSEDTSDEDLLAAVTEATSGNEDEETEENTEEEQEETEEVMASEHLKKLAESDPFVAHLLAEREENAKRLHALEVSNRLSEVTIQLGELGTDNVKLAPGAKKALSDVLINVPKGIGDKIVNIAKLFCEGKGTVQLGELGGKPNGTSTQDGDPGVEFDALVKKFQEGDDKLSFADAVVKASEANPDLANAYRRSSYAFKED